MADADTGAKPVDQATLVSDIDRTRAELARTIDAISERVSPKRNVDRTMEEFRQRVDQTRGQALQRFDEARGQALARASQVDPLIAGAAAAAVAVAVTAVVLWRRRRR